MPTAAIDCFHEPLASPGPDEVIVAVDVIRATPTAVTAVATGKRLYPAGSIEAAVRLAADLDRPILAGELGGVQPYGFDMQNSPCEVEELGDDSRPIILLSTSGTRLMMEAADRGACRPACLRNARAQGAQLAHEGAAVVILGADSRGEFRDEDRLCAARIARPLLEAGHEPADRLTAEIVERWGDAPVDALLQSRSARYLRETAQEHDLEVGLGHIHDVGGTLSGSEGGGRLDAAG